MRPWGSRSAKDPWLRPPPRSPGCASPGCALPGGPKESKLQGAGSPKETGCAFPWCALGLLGPSPKLGPKSSAFEQETMQAFGGGFVAIACVAYRLARPDHSNQKMNLENWNGLMATSAISRGLRCSSKQAFPNFWGLLLFLRRLFATMRERLRGKTKPRNKFEISRKKDRRNIVFGSSTC